MGCRSAKSRWVPIRTASGVLGWISDQYVAPIIVAAPQPSPTPELATAEAPVAEAPATLPSPEPMLATGQAPAPVAAKAEPGRPVDVEVKVKFPEAKGRHQEVSIWVTRDGQPIEGATVTMQIPDDEDQELRTLEPTDAEGRTGRDFTLGRNKGSVNMVISAVAPDGGKGQTEASYFVR